MTKNNVVMDTVEKQEKATQNAIFKACKGLDATKKDDFISGEWYQMILESYHALKNDIMLMAYYRHNYFLSLYNKDLFKYTLIDDEQKVYKVLGINKNNAIISRYKEDIISKTSDKNFKYTVLTPCTDADERVVEDIEFSNEL